MTISLPRKLNGNAHNPMKSKIKNNKLQISQTMKTRFALVVLALVSTSTIILGCNSTTAAASEIRSVDKSFYGIILNGNANVYLSQGETNSVRVEGLDENTQDVTTAVSNGALVINAGS